MADGMGYDGGLTCSMECSDLDKSVAWYREVLGFEVLFSVEEIAWCEMRTHMPRVNVGLSQVEQPQTRGGATLTWGVLDIDAARKTLESKRVRFDGETMTIEGMVRLATFFDPDGNRHMLYQDLSGQ